MEDNNRVIREMRRKIQLLAAEKESLEKSKERCQDLEHEVAGLRKETAELEEAMARLCESPFIDTFYKNEDGAPQAQKRR